MQIILLKLITKEFSQKENKPLKINKKHFTMILRIPNKAIYQEIWGTLFSFFSQLYLITSEASDSVYIQLYKSIAL